MRTIGAEVSHTLAQYGVRHIFGVPGVHNLELYRGMSDAGLTHILARHEQGAGFMADGYARASQQIGVAYVISGPGLCNIMTPMGQAYSDSVPLLVISSALPEPLLGQTKLHQMKDQRGAAETVCDWSEIGENEERLSTLIETAFYEFQMQRPRPKHIQIPLDLLSSTTAGFSTPAPHPEEERIFDDKPLIDALKSAQQPLFIIGGGAKHAQLEALAKRVNAALFETYSGKAVMPYDYPLNYGSFLARPSSAHEIAKADVVVIFGSELSEVDLWREELGADAPLFVVDKWPENHPLLEQASFIEGDCAAVVEHLLKELAPQSSLWNERDVQSARVKFKAETNQERQGLVEIIAGLASDMPDDLWVVSDMTQFAYVAKEVFPLKRAGQWLHPFGFGTLGYALPAAIGAKIAKPDAPILAIAGDYGFQYTLNELGTAVEHQLGLPILLWDNAELKEITASMERIQMPPLETSMLNPNFEYLARAYGADYVKPQSVTEMNKEIHAGFDGAVPKIIHVTPLVGG